jgi:hypothetical protein
LRTCSGSGTLAFDVDDEGAEATSGGLAPNISQPTANPPMPAQASSLAIL